MWLAVIAVIVAGGSGLGFYLNKREAPISIQTDTVQRRDLTETVVANGRIQPVIQVKISPEVSGEIIELPVREGQHVEKGDLLLRIKPDFYLASRRSAEASFKSSEANRTLSEANLKKAEAEFKRNEQLLRSQLISESVFLEFKTAFDVAQASFRSAEHQIEVARAALARADEELAKTTIFSPITGTVSKLNSQLGERVVGTAMMTGTEVMTVADLNEMEARVDIGEIDVVLIGVSQNARLEVDAFRDRKFSGTVTEIANSSRNTDRQGSGGGGGGGGQQQEATRFEVRIRVTEKEPFRPGMSVTAEIETRSRTNVLTVPFQSVTTRLPKTNSAGTTNGPSISTTNSQSAQAGNGSKTDGKSKEGKKPIEVVFLLEGDQVKSVPVKLGINDGNHTEITEGLTEGQEIVSGGYKAISRDLDDGKKVKKGGAESEKPKP